MAQIYKARSPIKLKENAPMLAIGIPLRKKSPVEFWMSFLPLLHPLNVKMGYLIQKGAENNVKDGKLPAEARNSIIERALSIDAKWLLFLDDDIIFPDVTAYRLLGLAVQHPEAGVITGVYSTKVSPSEPLLYIDDTTGAFWNWPLGALVPIHSAGAGCMIVNMDHLKKMEAPWFNDTVTQGEGENHKWGHDRYFMMKMKEQAGAEIYADTGLLLGHFDVDSQIVYTLPSTAPCFQMRPEGESYVPVMKDDGVLMWRRILVDKGDESFVGYMDWLVSKQNPLVTKMDVITENQNAG